MARILYIAYPLLQVFDESAGGAEQILWTLEREMAHGGELTAVAASAGSRVSGELFSTGEPCRQPDDYERRRIEHEDRVVDFVHQCAREGKAFDLIHDMSGSFWKRAAEIDAPVLATLHLPRSFYPAAGFLEVSENVTFNCVSDSQARSFADLNALAGVVPNGIALDCFVGNDGAEINGLGRKELLWLGRICEEKAPHLALDIAQKARLPITIAGQVYPFSYHQQYFEREVVPRLRTMPNARFIAAPSAELKRRLLQKSRALLITSLAEETSSLVAMEAAASGTPVIAFRRGALPEVVQEGMTGFLVESVDQAVMALKQVSSISPASCVRHARENFGAARMADRYAALYARIVRAETILPTR
ncbi:MAG TPA: glycosyltransferase [Candidatus Dormibacteraeota bacterium]|jgi:glycosyltransferase involved in cell wall biosynthesis|nr:glycosyltransferase [Candidatus Dormibacteraeota bacterium]